MARDNLNTDDYKKKFNKILSKAEDDYSSSKLLRYDKDFSTYKNSFTYSLKQRKEQLEKLKWKDVVKAYYDAKFINRVQLEVYKQEVCPGKKPLAEEKQPD